MRTATLMTMLMLIGASAGAADPPKAKPDPALKAKVALALAQAKPPAPEFVEQRKAEAAAKATGAVLCYCVGNWAHPPEGLPAGTLCVRVASFAGDGQPADRPRVAVVAGSVAQPVTGTLADAVAAAKKTLAPAKAAKLDWDF